VGDDGHTASLFPDGPELRVRDRSVVASVDTESDEARITLTFPVINAAKRVEILVLEREKAGLVAELILGNSHSQAYPASSVAPQGDLVWMLGPAAARGILVDEPTRMSVGA
jgi:6-phosphogluconolactonase